MKAMPPGLQAHLDSGTTTLCWCWRISPRRGARLGFTDHDRNLVFDGTTFEAATGFTASEVQSSVGLSVDNLEVDSALVSDRLSETALAAGDFDDASIEIFRVNWSDTAQRVLMRRGSLGEVRRTATAFTAEVRGLAHYLQQPNGRLFGYGCDAEIGDSRCGIDLDAPANRASGTITAITGPRLFTASGLAAFGAGRFTRGLLSMTSGANAGRACEIKRHGLTGSTASLELWQAFPFALAIGETFTVTVGCDKQFATCRDTFANAERYRGFPHMPGNDYLTTPAAAVS